MGQATQRQLRAVNDAAPAEPEGITRRLPEKVSARLELLRGQVIEAERETQRCRVLFLESLTSALIGMGIDIDAYNIEPTPDLKAVLMMPLAAEPPAPEPAPDPPSAVVGAESG